MMPPVQMRAARSSKAARRFAAMPGSASFDQEPAAGSGTRRGLVGVGGVFFGRPPSLPFSRTALALASEVTRPPRRPSACAALFIGFALADDFLDLLDRAPLADARNPVGAVIGAGVVDRESYGGGARAEGFGDGLLGVGRGAHFGFQFFGFVSAVVASIYGDNTKPLRFVTNYFRKSFERENSLGRRGCGAGENALERHEGKTLNARIRDEAPRQ